MADDDYDGKRHELRQILRVARFRGWELEDLEDAILGVFGRGVSTTTPHLGPTSIAP
jgi:hypothetical protein